MASVARALSWYQALTLSVGLFLIGVFGSLAMVSWVVVRLPPNYFRHEHAPAFWADRSPSFASLAGRQNLIGLVLIAIGIVLRCQRWAGYSHDPDRRHVRRLSASWLERWIVSKKLVLQAVNHLRPATTSRRWSWMSPARRRPSTR